MHQRSLTALWPEPKKTALSILMNTAKRILPAAGGPRTVLL